MRNVATDGHATSSTAGSVMTSLRLFVTYEDNPDDVYTLDEIRAEPGAEMTGQRSFA